MRRKLSFDDEKDLVLLGKALSSEIRIKILKSDTKPTICQIIYIPLTYRLNVGKKPILSGACNGICGKASCPGILFASINNGPFSVIATSQPIYPSCGSFSAASQHIAIDSSQNGI